MNNIKDPFMYGGEDVFGCEYCAGMGYEDYPSQQIPCRISGHMKRANKNERDVMCMMDGLRRQYSISDGECPFCKSQGKPTGIDCAHWDGLGWSRMENPPKRDILR